MRYGIDWLVTRSDLVFGLGWLGVPGGEIERLSLELTGADGASDTLPVSRIPYGDVVAPYLGGASRAGVAGFSVYGVTAAAPLAAARLRVDLTDGSRTVVEAPFEDLRSPSPPSLRRTWSRRRNQVRKAWALARRMRFGELARRVRARRSRGTPLTEADPIPLISERCEALSRTGIGLVIDHALGGGANRYREDLILDRFSEGDIVGIVFFNLPTLQYALEVRAPGSEPARFALPSLEPVLELARRSRLSAVVFNNAVSFPNPLEIPRLLAELKLTYGVPLSIATHDYFALCPSPYLLDSGGSYCALPDLDTCRRCLPANHSVLFGHGKDLDIEEWRGSWGRALGLADEVLCFSESSIRLLTRVFPELAGPRLQLRPHRPGKTPLPRPRVETDGPLRLGVAGSITYPKGARVVADLAECIRERGLDVRIAVFGTLDEAADPDVVWVSGAYRRPDLPRLVERWGANLMLLPSIVPETYSYVAAELMEMELPIVCFDIGAPAERLASYPLGRVIPLGSPDLVLEQLLEFHGELQSAARPLERV